MAQLTDKPFARALGNGETETHTVPVGTRVNGVIYHLDENRGYGFIMSDSSGYKFTRIFFHWTALEEDTLHFTELKKGMKVEFEPRIFDNEGKKRYRAIRISVTGKAEKHELDAVEDMSAVESTQTD